MPPEVAELILGQFGAEAARLRSRLAAAPGKPAGPEIDGALAQFFDLQRIVERPPAPPVVPPAPPVPPPPPTATEEIRKLPPSVLARALEGEQPGTIALVLSCLDNAPAGQVMQRLALDVRAEVALRLSKLGARNPVLLGRLVAAVAEKARRLGELPREPTPEELITNLADMLRAVPRAERLPVVKKIELADPDLAAKIIERLYRLEDLLRIPDRQIQTLLGKLDVKTLAVALKGADPAIMAKVSGNMSSRSREVLNDESALLGAVPASRVRDAQLKVIAIIRKAEEDGEVTPEE
jgi:flagellar motor switch protein FliG